jgi:hypothetical protein
VTVIANYWDNVFGIVPMCGLDTPGYESWQGHEISTWIHCGEKSETGMKWTSHLHIVLRLRMREAVSLLPLDAFMAQSGTNMPSFLSYIYIYICLVYVVCLFMMCCILCLNFWNVFMVM